MMVADKQYRELQRHGLVTHNEMSILGYSTYCQDDGSRGGDVLVYVARSCRSWH